MSTEITGTLSAGTITQAEPVSSAIRSNVADGMIQDYNTFRNQFGLSLASQSDGTRILLERERNSAANIAKTVDAAVVGNVSQSGTGDIIEMAKIFASLANSASPPTPAYQNLGPMFPGGATAKPAGTATA
jgi:hypothetical protein